jgi:hypothetical protein
MFETEAWVSAGETCKYKRENGFAAPRGARGSSGQQRNFFRTEGFLILKETCGDDFGGLGDLSDAFSTAVHSLPQITFWYCLPISDSAVVLPQHAKPGRVGGPARQVRYVPYRLGS